MERVVFDLIFEAYNRRNQGERAKTIDMGLTRNDHTNVWGELSRRQLVFIRDRIDAYLEDTAQDNNMVYLMACGHELDSPYRLSRHSRGHCSVHGFQRLVPHGLMADEFLPDYKPATRKAKKR